MLTSSAFLTVAMVTTTAIARIETVITTGTTATTTAAAKSTVIGIIVAVQKQFRFVSGRWGC